MRLAGSKVDSLSIPGIADLQDKGEKNCREAKMPCRANWTD
jgi:hypothetical protein